MDYKYYSPISPRVYRGFVVAHDSRPVTQSTHASLTKNPRYDTFTIYGKSEPRGDFGKPRARTTKIISRGGCRRPHEFAISRISKKSPKRQNLVYGPRPPGGNRKEVASSSSGRIYGSFPLKKPPSCILVPGHQHRNQAPKISTPKPPDMV